MDSGKTTDFADLTARGLTSVLYLLKPEVMFSEGLARWLVLRPGFRPWGMLLGPFFFVFYIVVKWTRRETIIFKHLTKPPERREA